MHQSDSSRKNHRMMREICVRAFFLCVLSCTSLLTVASSFGPGLAIAAPAHNVASNVVTRIQSTSVSQPSSPAKAQHIHRTSHGLQHAAAALGPDLAMSLTANATSYTVGQVVTYALNVTNNATAASILAGAPITVTDVLPLGLTGIAALALPGQWNLSLSASTSPAILTATYTGATPVTPGEALPTITLFGVLAPTAQGTFSNTASVSVAGDLNLTDNIAMLSLPVSAASTATATVAPTATATVAPTATATVAPTATATVAPTATATVVPTATATVVSAPDLAMSLTANAPGYTVGQVVTYTLRVTNKVTAASILAGAPIAVTDVLPLGLTSIAALALPGQWNLSLSASTSPAILTAMYTGATPVTPGEVLPAITLFGVLAPTAQGTFSNTASASVAGDLNLTDNIVTLSLPVSAASTPTPTATVVPTATATVTPTVVPTATVVVPTMTPPITLPPHLSIAQSFANSNPLQVGQPATLTLAVSNGNSAGTIQQGASIQVDDILPLGFNQISASGNDWFIFTTSPTGPALLSAIYTGPILISPGEVLPPITVTGVLDANILPSLINTASVSTTGDASSADNVSTVIITVIPSPTPTAVAAPDLNIVQSILGPGANNRVVSGQAISITLASNNLASAGPLARASTVTIYDVLPAGLSQIAATGNNWFILVTSTTGPALLTAIYSSAAPLQAGQALPLLTIRGVVNANVGNSTLTNTAVISAPDDVNTVNNTTTATVHVYLPITPTVPAPVVSPGAAAFIFRERSVHS